VKAAAAGEGSLVVEGLGRRMMLRQVAPMLRDALHRLGPPGENEDSLAELVRAGENGALARWYYYLECLSRRGLLCQAVDANGTRLATLVPVSASFVPRREQAVASRRYVLSRFALMRRDGAESVLESPLAHARVILNDDRTAAVVAALMAPVTVQDLAA